MSLPQTKKAQRKAARKLKARMREAAGNHGRVRKRKRVRAREVPDEERQLAAAEKSVQHLTPAEQLASRVLALPRPWHRLVLELARRLDAVRTEGEPRRPRSNTHWGTDDVGPQARFTP